MPAQFNHVGTVVTCTLIWSRNTCTVKFKKKWLSLYRNMPAIDTPLFLDMVLSPKNFVLGVPYMLMNSALHPGALPLWRWRGYKDLKTPYFQRCCHPMTRYFCWLSLLSPKDPTFFCEMWALRSLSPKTPYKTNHFCHFRRFGGKFLLLKRSLKDQK